MDFIRPCSPWVSFYAPDKAFTGYTLFSPIRGTVAWLVNMEGSFVHCWEMSRQPGSIGKLLPNGNLLYAGKDVKGPMAKFGGGGGSLVEVEWDGKVLWKYEHMQHHHDFERLSNGNTLLLTRIEVPTAIARKVQGGIPETEENGTIFVDSFHEVAPDGKVVWEWLGYEHLDPEIDIICPLCPRDEWIHANCCSVTPHGDILTCFRYTNSIAIIDKSSGAIKWRWGTGELAHPHNATMLDNGNILVFDNGDHRLKEFGNYSRVVEVNPHTGEIEWEFKSDPPNLFFSIFMSGCQRLPNGNTLISEGVKGKIFEVTPDKEIVWEYASPFYFRDTAGSNLGWTNGIHRAFRYGADYEGLQGKPLDPDIVELTLRKNPLRKEAVLQGRLKRLGY